MSTFRHLKGWAFAAGMILVAVAASPSNAQPQPPAGSTSASVTDLNRRIIEEGFDRWATQGVSIFGDILSPDIVWTIKGSGPSAGTFRGRDVLVERAVRPFQSRLANPVRPVARRVWADGDYVIVNWDGEGMARDGQPYRNSYAWIFRMRDGKAVEVTAFLDLVPYDAVLHRVPAPPGSEDSP